MNKHKKVQVVILKGQQILLFKTNKQRGSFWQNVTGSVEGTESFLPAAKREVREETGLINLDFKQLPPIFTFRDRWGLDVLEKTFIARIKDENPVIKIDSREHDEFSWHESKTILPKNYHYASNYQTFLAALNFLQEQEQEQEKEQT